MDEDCRNAFGSLMCTEICDGAGAEIGDGSPSTCSSFIYISEETSPLFRLVCTNCLYTAMAVARIWLITL